MNYCDSLIARQKQDHKKRLMFEVETGRTLTFGETLSRVRSLAADLKRRGIGPKSAVALHLFNSIDAALFHMAVQYVGARSCLIDALIQPKALDYYVRLTESTLLVTHVREDALAEAGLSSLDTIFADDIRSLSEIAPPSGLSDPVDRPDDDTAYIYFTSGTTSTPKGVMLSPGNHKIFTAICDTYWQPVTESSKHICFVPFSHGFGTVFLLPLAMRTASELYIMRAFHPLRVADTVAKHGITHMYGVPSHYQQLLRLPNARSVLTSIEAAFCAAAKLEHSLMLEWEDASGTILCEGYGLIETCCGIVWRVGTPSLGTGHMGPCPDPSLAAIQIFDKDLRPVPRGETGQIAVRGPSVMKGYLHQQEETDRVMHDGWFLTGDEGHITPEGELFMTGRIKDIINIAGIKVSPYEVEAVLEAHPSIAEVAVVAAPDKLYGEVVKAFIRLEPGRSVTERDLIRFASEHLINFQVPKIVDFVDKFPLNNMGKLDRKKLKAMSDEKHMGSIK